MINYKYKTNFISTFFKVAQYKQLLFQTFAQF